MKKILLCLYLFISFTSVAVAPAYADKVSRPITAWPFVLHHEDENTAETDILWPLFHHEREKTRTLYSIRPFIFSTESDPERNYNKTSFLWPITIYKREGERSSFHVFPLYWYKSTPDEGHSILVPLYWHGRGKDSSYTHLWPLFSRLEQGSYREYGSLYPLIRFGRDPEKDVALDHFLLFYHKRERDKSFATLFPLYGRKVDGPWKKSWLLPLYYSERDADSLLTIGLPGLPYYHRKEPGSDTLHLWPLFSRLEQGSYREYGSLYPLIRFGRDPEKDVALDHFLLYYHKRERDKSFTTLFPIYGRKVDGPEKKSWLIPLYYSKSDADSLFTVGLPGLPYYHQKEPGSNTVHLWPLFSKLEKGSYREYGSLYPLIRFGRDPEKDIALDHFLLYYHKREGDRSFTAAFPLYWSTSEGGKKLQLFIPLYYHREDADSLLTFAPLYYHHKKPGMDTLYFWPFYRFHEHGAYREYSVFYPLIRFGRDPEKDVALDHFLLYYHQREQDRSFSTLVPFWFSSRKPQSEWDLVLPLYFSQRKPNETTRVAPLYFERVTPEASVRTVVPLYFNRVSASGQFRYVFPTYFNVEKEKTRLNMLLPLYLTYKSPTSSFSAFTPLFMKRTSDESRFTTVLPLYYDYEKEDFALTLGLPVYLRYRSGPFSLSTIFPVYYRSQDSEKKTGFTYYFPFYGEYRRADTVSRHFLLFPLYSRYSDQELQITGWDVLWPFFHYESSPTTRSVRIPPFYWHGSNPENAYTVFFPFYWSFDSNEDSYRHVIPFYGVHRQGDWYRKSFVFGPLFMNTQDSRRGLSRQDGLLWFYSRRVEGENRLSWLFPVYYSRSDADSLLTLALPVLPYYHSKEQGRETLNLFPLYRLKREGTYTEHASFWPLIRFGRDPEKDITLDHFLLYYHRREGDKSFTTAFPLYWSKREGAKKQQLLIPLYYLREDADSRLTFAPLYYHRKEPGITTLYFWPFYRFHEQAGYREHGLLYPLIRFGRDLEKDIALDHFLLYYHKREGNRAFTTAFPLYWSKKEGEKKQQLLIPLYYHREDADSLLTFAPLYYHRKEPGSDSLHLWPLFGKEKRGSYREYGTLYPLIRFGRDGEQQVALDQFLFYYHKKERNNAVTTFFPLYWSRREGEKNRQVLIPLYYHRENADSFVTLAPLFYHRKKPGSDSMHVWPLFGKEERGSYREYGTLYPLIRFGRDQEKDVSLDHFLLYYHKRTRNNAFTTLFPLYGSRIQGQERKRWILPVYYSESDEDSLLTLAPLYYHHREKDTNTIYLPPFYRYYEKGSYREHGFLYPFARFGRDAERNTALDHFLLYYHKREGASSFSTVFPLWWHQEKDENKRRDASLFFHWYERDETRDEASLSLFWLIPPKVSLFRYSREGGAEQHRFFPLYSYSYNKELDAVEWSVLWFLFSYRSEGELVQQTGFLWRVISYERQGDSSDFRFLWRVIRKSSTSTSSIFEFNPFYYHESEEGKGSYWAILGGLIGVETTPDDRKKLRLLWIF